VQVSKVPENTGDHYNMVGGVPPKGQVEASPIDVTVVTVL